MSIITIAIINTVTVVIAFKFGKIVGRSKGVTTLLKFFKETEDRVQELAKIKDSFNSLPAEEKHARYDEAAKLQGSIDTIEVWATSLGITVERK